MSLRHRSAERLAMTLMLSLLALGFVVALPALAGRSQASLPVMRNPAVLAGVLLTDTVKTNVESVLTPQSPSATPTRDMYVSNSSGVAAPGRRLSYSIVVRNQGNTPAANVVLTDTLPPNVTYIASTGCAVVTPTIVGNVVVWNFGTVAAGIDNSVNVEVTVTQATAVGSVLTNVVQIATSDPDINLTNNVFTRTTLVVASGVDVRISKSIYGAAGTPAGEMVYSLSYYNNGTDPASSVVVTDVLPPEVTYITHTASNVTPTIVGNTVVFARKASLEGGSSDDIRIRVRVNPTVAIGTVITNVARISTADPELNPANNVVTNTVAITTPAIDLSVSKSLGAGLLRTGSLITYGLSFNSTSNNNFTATHVVLTDVLPAGLSFVSWSGGFTSPSARNLVGVVTPTVNGNQIVWQLGDFAPSASGSINVVARIADTVSPGTVLTNTAVIATPDAVDISPSNNSSASVAVASYSCGPDAFGYRCRPTFFKWIDGTSGADTGIHGDDSAAGPYPIGFDFPFYGTVYSETYLSTNGLVFFGSKTTTFSNVPMPLPSTPNNMLAPMWDDLYLCSQQAKIYTRQGGVAPDRYWVVEWNDVARFSERQVRLTFEAVLYENGSIVYQYQTMTGTLDSATVGIENATGLDGLQYLYNQPGLGSNRAVLFVPPGGAFPPAVFLPLVRK